MFGPLTVCYLFLGGTGAGACLVSAVLGLLCPAEMIVRRVSCHMGGTSALVSLPSTYRRLLVPGIVAGLAALGVGIVCLLADVGRIDRVELLLVSPALSYMAIGTWALVICASLSMFLAGVWIGLAHVSLVVVRIVEVALSVASLVVMAYTGLLLQGMSSVPVWTTPWLPVLFVLSSLSCGCAVVLMGSQFSGAASTFSAVFQRLVVVDSVIIVCEVLVVALYLAVVLGFATLGAPAFSEASGTAQALMASAQDLVGGVNAWLFWGVFAVGGLALPLVLDLLLARLVGPTHLFALVAAAGVLVGGFVLRYCVVEAGLHPVLQVMM